LCCAVNVIKESQREKKLLKYLVFEVQGQNEEEEMKFIVKNVLLDKTEMTGFL
jgi:hypothetical protein